jgi:hypothetical protein
MSCGDSGGTGGASHSGGDSSVSGGSDSIPAATGGGTATGGATGASGAAAGGSLPSGGSSATTGGSPANGGVAGSSGGSTGGAETGGAETGGVESGGVETGGRAAGTGGASTGGRAAGTGGVGTGGTATGDAGAGGTPADGCQVSSVPADVRSSYKIDTFYQKYSSANGIVIATSSKVGDEAIIRDCRLLLDLYRKRDAARQSIISQKVFFTLIAQSEQLSSLPEVSSVWGTSLDQRARGLGSMTPTICAEDSIMCMAGDPWVGDCICPHEYGHTLADLALGRGEPAMASRLKTIYDDIVSSDRLANAYVHEDGGTSGLMAWGVQAWYSCAINGTRGAYHSDINTREELKSELPDFYNFLAEVLPEDNDYVDCYTKP